MYTIVCWINHDVFSRNLCFIQKFLFAVVVVHIGLVTVGLHDQKSGGGNCKSHL